MWGAKEDFLLARMPGDLDPPSYLGSSSCCEEQVYQELQVYKEGWNLQGLMSSKKDEMRTEMRQDV